MPRFLNFILLIVPALAAVAGLTAGIPIWRTRAGVPSDSTAAWLWVLGGFIALVGGVFVLKRWRWIALVYIFAGFVLLFSAGLYLPEARRAYDNWQDKQSIRTPDKSIQPMRDGALESSRSRRLFYVAVPTWLSSSRSETCQQLTYVLGTRIANEFEIEEKFIPVN